MISKDLQNQFISNLKKYIGEGYSLGYSRFKAGKDVGVERMKVWDLCKGEDYQEIRNSFQKQYFHNRKWVK